MANTRNSQKNENDDEPAAARSQAVADAKDSGGNEPTVSDLVRLIQAQGATLQSEIQAWKSEIQAQGATLRSMEAKFDEKLEKIESTSDHHEEALLSFSTRLDRIENQLAEQNMQHDNNQSGNNQNNQNVNHNQNVNSSNHNGLFNHGGGRPARIRFQ